MVRIAVIGAGRIAELHLGGYRRAGAEVVGVADVDLERARAKAEPVGARAYADHREMLARERPDAVSICTPPYLHRQHLLDAVAAGAAVLAEKPFALTLDEGREMVAAARAAGMLLAVNFAHRYYEPTERVKALLAEGALGRPISFRVRFGVSYVDHRQRPWLFRRDLAGGGAFMDTASHGIDLFRHLVGEVERVFALARRNRPDVEVEDTGVFVLEAAGGPLGVVEADWSTPGHDYGWSLHGTGGAAYVGYYPPTLRYRLAGQTDWNEVPFPPEARLGRFDHLVADFLRCLATGETPRGTGADGLRALELVMAGYSSAETGRAVPCPQ